MVENESVQFTLIRKFWTWLVAVVKVTKSLVFWSPATFRRAQRLVQHVNQQKYLPDESLEDPLLVVGEHTYGRPRIVRWDGGTRVVIGKFCSIATGVTVIAGGDHRLDWVTTYPLHAKLNLSGVSPSDCHISKGDVVIGSDVWIGRGAVILSGVEVGDGAVIGAHSVVAKAVPPYAVVVGNPAAVVSMRFKDEQVRDLLRIRWWDWPLERIVQHAPFLSSADVDGFIRVANLAMSH